ncbi:MAG: glycosyltransferase [Planctomycetota bacterium]
MTEFARHFDRVFVFAPVTAKPSYFSGCPLNMPDIKVIALPYFETHAQAYKHALTISRLFHQYASSLDVINCRGTAPLAYLLWWFTRRRKVPFIYHFASDPFEVLDTSPRYAGIYGRFARLGYGIEFSIQKHIMRRNFSFASGINLCERLRKITPNIEPLVDSTLQEQDYFLRQDCCTSRELQLLYVGRLKAGKGLEHLIEAVKILRNNGRNVKLDLVGEGELQQTLVKLAEKLNLAQNVRFRGFAVMGPLLNHYYNNADIFILPSLSEGSPKAVLEALAHSLPVVATTVGNIPTMLDQGRRGILIPVRDPSSIAQAVMRVVDDPIFRQACIRGGYDYAREHSAERFIARMAKKARSLVEEGRKGVST